MTDQNSLLANFRKPTWEEDISLNHDTTDPFVNDPPPCEIALEEFKTGDVLPTELLGDTPLETFIQRDQLPIPGVADREGYNPNFNARFFITGLADYLKITDAASRHGIPLNSYLDFGCASGRVLRHFCCQSEIEDLWGVDINGRHVRWLNDYLPPKLKIAHTHSIPYLPVADQSIDVVSAFSVFTHIDTFETGWLAEIYRVLKPGGMCYLTVQNDDTWKLLQQAGENNGLLKRFMEIDPTFEEQLKSDIPQERRCYRYTDLGPYRALVVHSNEYLKKTWGRFFDILEIKGKYHGYMQSVLIGKKK